VALLLKRFSCQETKGDAAMVIDSGEQSTSASVQPLSDLLGRAAAQVQQLLCGLHGHDALLHFEESRISLQCTSCGYNTPGWDLKREAAIKEPSAEAQRPVRVPFLGLRRVA